MLKKTSLLTLISLLLVATVHARISRLSFETRGLLFSYMGDKKLISAGNRVEFCEKFEAVEDSSKKSSTIGFVGAEVGYQASDRLSISLGSYIERGGVEYAAEVRESDPVFDDLYIGKQEFRNWYEKREKLAFGNRVRLGKPEFLLSLQCNLPLLLGTRYDFYKSASINIGAGLGVGVVIWTASSRLQGMVSRDNKAFLKENSHATLRSDSSAGPAVIGDVCLEWRVTELSSIRASLGYSFLSKPRIDLPALGRNEILRLEPGAMHGLLLSASINFAF